MSLGMAGRPKRRARLMAEGKWPSAGKDVIRGTFKADKDVIRGTFKTKPAKKAAGSKTKKPVDLTMWVHNFNAAMNQENCNKAQKLLKSLPRADRKKVDFDYYADAVHRTCGSDELDGLGELSTGAKVGIGVGLAALVGGGVWWFFLRGKSKKALRGRAAFTQGPLVDMTGQFAPATVTRMLENRGANPIGIPGAGGATKDMY